MPHMAFRSEGAAGELGAIHNLESTMIEKALFVRLEARPGKEQELAHFLQAGLDMTQQESTTPVCTVDRTHRCARRQAARLKAGGQRPGSACATGRPGSMRETRRSLPRFRSLAAAAEPGCFTQHLSVLSRIIQCKERGYRDHCADSASWWTPLVSLARAPSALSEPAWRQMRLVHSR